jgi:exopolyphosphatase/guanosine-5'-triphosphate,3'-diphosphate pyrophosphatase
MSDTTGNTNDTVGVVDIGSNSVKLLILDGNDVLHRDSVVTRLGSGVAATGNLSEDSIAASRQRFGEIRALLDEHGVTDTWAVATAAVRNAANSARFVELARDTLGCDVAVIDGHTEGNLSFLGAQRNLTVPDGSGPVTVIDIGGGSTEFAVGDPSATPRVVSIPYGARNLTEKILRHDPPRPEELTNAIGAVIDEVDDVLREIPELETCERLIGVAGTVVTIAMVELGLQSYDASVLHGMHLERDAAEDVFRTLATESLADRVYNPGLPADRADIIVGGCCALVAILRKLQLQRLTVSTTSLADGVAMVARQRRDQLSGGAALSDVLRDFFRP